MLILLFGNAHVFSVFVFDMLLFNTSLFLEALLVYF